MQTYQETKTTKVTQIDHNDIPADVPVSNIPPATINASHMPSGGFQNQTDFFASEKSHHDVPVTRDQAIPSPVVTQGRLRQGEILRAQSKELSRVSCDDQQIHMPGEPCENLPPNGPDPIHEHSKPGLGAKIKGGIGQAQAWVNEKLHPAHPTRDTGVQQHFGIQPGQGLTQPLYQYSNYGPGVTDLPPQPINKLDNFSTQTQAGDSIKSDLKSELGANLPPTSAPQKPLTMKERIEIASVSKMPVDLSDMGLTNKPVVVKADIPVANVVVPGGSIGYKQPYNGMPEEYKQEYYAKATALQKEHITKAGKKTEDMGLTEKIKDTAATGWEVAKEKASEAKEYLDEKYSGDNSTWDTIKEKASDAKEWVDEKLASDEAQKALETVKEKAVDAKEWAEKNITKENTEKAWETVKEKASDAKEYLDENLTGETSSKVWETVKEKASDAKEYLDETLVSDKTSKAWDTVKEKASDAKEYLDENLSSEKTSQAWDTVKGKANDAKEYLDENLTGDKTSKAWKTLQDKTVDAKEWVDDKLESAKGGADLKRKDLDKKLNKGKEKLDSTWDKLKDKASEAKTSLDRKMSMESKDPSPEFRQKKNQGWEEEISPKKPKEGKFSGERFSEKEQSGWENWKPTGNRVTDMLERKLRSEPEKSLKQREYEAAEHTREVKLDWGRLSTKDKIKDSFFEGKHAWNDMGGFLKSDF